MSMFIKSLREVYRSWLTCSGCKVDMYFTASAYILGSFSCMSDNFKRVRARARLDLSRAVQIRRASHDCVHLEATRADGGKDSATNLPPFYPLAILKLCQPMTGCHYQRRHRRALAVSRAVV